MENENEDYATGQIDVLKIIVKTLILVRQNAEEVESIFHQSFAAEFSEEMLEYRLSTSKRDWVKGVLNMQDFISECLNSAKLPRLYP